MLGLRLGTSSSKARAPDGSGRERGVREGGQKVYQRVGERVVLEGGSG